MLDINETSMVETTDTDTNDSGLPPEIMNLFESMPFMKKLMLLSMLSNAPEPDFLATIFARNLNHHAETHEYKYTFQVIEEDNQVVAAIDATGQVVAYAFCSTLGFDIREGTSYSEAKEAGKEENSDRFFVFMDVNQCDAHEKIFEILNEIANKQIVNLLP